MKKYCHNSKTGEIFSYHEADGITDFPRGDFLAYGDYLTTGFTTRSDAEKWATEYGACPKCRSSRPRKENQNTCLFCNSVLTFMPVKPE